MHQLNVERALRRRYYDRKRAQRERQGYFERILAWSGLVLIASVLSYQVGRGVEACAGIGLTVAQCAVVVVSDTPHTDIYRFQEQNAKEQEK